MYKYQQVAPPIMPPGEMKDRTKIYRTRDPRLPYQSIAQEKPAGMLRVVTVGGSATAGLGYSPNVTFARHLERMLRQAYPERAFDVMNLGIVALSSRQVKQIVADVCERLDPDVLVVYSGNNEFLEIHAEKYAEAQKSVYGGIADVFKNTNFFRLVSAVGKPQDTSIREDELSNDDRRITQGEMIEEAELTPEELGAVIDAYEANIEEMSAPLGVMRWPLLSWRSLQTGCGEGAKTFQKTGSGS